MDKLTRHKAIVARAKKAIASLYHNATPSYPYPIEERFQSLFDSWFQESASNEIDNIQCGGDYWKDYRKVLQAPCNAGQFKSKAAQRYYVQWHLRNMRLDRAKGGAWKLITQYGNLYTYGRGGRTLAPEHLIRTHGCSSFSVNDDATDNYNIESLVDLIHIVESFNAYVLDWNNSIPEMWEEYLDEYKEDENQTDDTSL
jgi:hypothetical protein